MNRSGNSLSLVSILPFLNMKAANFFAFGSDDESAFDSIAPTLSANPFVKNAWGVLNLAQCSQANGEENGTWNEDFLADTFGAYIGRLTSEMHKEISALWNKAAQ